MKRSPKDVFSYEKNTAGRRDHIDYDYTSKLSEKDQEWLAQFTDEYYASSFEINPTFAKKSEAIKICKAEIDKILKTIEDIDKFLATPTKQYIRWNHNLNKYKKTSEKFVQISGFKQWRDNLDLRKCRLIKLYRMDKNGKLSLDKKYKYNSIQDFEEYGKDCNNRSKESSQDIYSVQRQSNQDSTEYYLEIQATDELSPEEYLLISDDYDIMVDCED